MFLFFLFLFFFLFVLLTVTYAIMSEPKGNLLHMWIESLGHQKLIEKCGSQFWEDLELTEKKVFVPLMELSPYKWYFHFFRYVFLLWKQ